MIGGRPLKGPLHDHPLAAARVVVAGGAIDVVAFPPTFQILASNREWESVCYHAIDFARIEQLVSPKMAVCHSTRHRWPLGPAVAEKRARVQRLVFGLNVHVQAT